LEKKSQAACEADCDLRLEKEAKCNGYAYNPDANNGECILYGPKLDGMCSDPSALNKAACDAIGSCDSPAAASNENECGTCKDKSSAKEEATCVLIDGTWIKGVWTSKGATWADAETPFTGESFPSVIIKNTTLEVNSKYNCYDVNIIDHLAHCIGVATDTSKDCTKAFDDVTEEDRTEANCYPGCTFSPAPKGPKNPTQLHSGDIKLPGWNPAESGACRGGADKTEKVNGKYSKTAGANGVLTQKECAEACLAEETCIGYAQSTSWCIVYGPDIHNVESDSPWTADFHNETAITGTKVNKAYICVTGPPRNKTPVSAPTAPVSAPTAPVSTTDPPTSAAATVFVAKIAVFLCVNFITFMS